MESIVLLLTIWREVQRVRRIRTVLLPPLIPRLLFLVSLFASPTLLKLLVRLRNRPSGRAEPLSSYTYISAVLEQLYLDTGQWN